MQTVNSLSVLKLKGERSLIDVKCDFMGYLSQGTQYKRFSSTFV